ncbi:MAG: hypothetical protein Q9178_007121 [Gyalolechia marmorata]
MKMLDAATYCCVLNVFRVRKEETCSHRTPYVRRKYSLGAKPIINSLPANSLLKDYFASCMYGTGYELLYSKEEPRTYAGAAAAPAKSFEHDNASRETEPHHAKRPPVTSRKSERLQHLPKSSASIENGRSGHLSSGDDWPHIIPPEEDGRRGAQTWSSKQVPLLDRVRNDSEDELYETLQSRKDPPGERVNKTLRIRRYHPRESTEKTPRIWKYSHTKIRTSKFQIASSIRLKARTVQSLGPETFSNEGRTLPVQSRNFPKPFTACQEPQLEATSWRTLNRVICTQCAKDSNGQYYQTVFDRIKGPLAVDCS